MDKVMVRNDSVNLSSCESSFTHLFQQYKHLNGALCNNPIVDRFLICHM